MLVADRIAEIATDARSDELELVGVVIREPRCDPAEGPAHVLPPALAWAPCPEERDRISCRPDLQTRCQFAVVDRPFRRDLTREHCGKKFVELTHSWPPNAACESVADV